MIVNCWKLCAGTLLAVLSCVPVFAGNTEIVAAFRDHVQSLQIEADQKKSAQERIDAFATDSPSDAITEGLIAIYPKYAKAIDSTEGDDPDLAVQLLTPLTKSEDKFLAADSSFFLARMLMNHEQFEAALPLLKSLGKDFSKHSIHANTSDYFLGIAYAGLLKNKNAMNAFLEFSKSSADAPERMVVSAWRQYQRLEAIEAGKLGDIHQRMEYSRRRLELKQTDDPTQQQQEKIVSMLTQLIKQAEKSEASKSSKNTKKQQQKQDQKPGQQKPQQAQNKPGKQQNGNNGENAQASDGKAIVKKFDDVPVSAWSRLRERSRDPANNAIKDKLPAKYRDIVEKYIEKANGEPEG